MSEENNSIEAIFDELCEHSNRLIKSAFNAGFVFGIFVTCIASGIIYLVLI